MTALRKRTPRRRPRFRNLSHTGQGSSARAGPLNQPPQLGRTCMAARARRGDPVTEGTYVTDGTTVEFGAVSGGLSGGQQLLTEPSGRCIAGPGDQDPARRERRLTGVDRPYVLVSCAMSLDGDIDDASATPLPLSAGADIYPPDDVLAGCDAV